MVTTGWTDSGKRPINPKGAEPCRFDPFFFNDAEILGLNTRRVSRRVAPAHGMVDLNAPAISSSAMVNQDKVLYPIDKGLLVFD